MCVCVCVCVCVCACVCVCVVFKLCAGPVQQAIRGCDETLVCVRVCVCVMYLLNFVLGRFDKLFVIVTKPGCVVIY